MLSALEVHGLFLLGPALEFGDEVRSSALTGRERKRERAKAVWLLVVEEGLGDNNTPRKKKKRDSILE